MLDELEGEEKFTLKYISCKFSKMGSHQTINPRRWGGGGACGLKSVSFRNATHNIAHISILSGYMRCTAFKKNIFNLLNLVSSMFSMIGNIL